MSVAQQSSIWQQQQSKQIASFTPKQPEIPSDGLCPPGDIECEANAPPPPSGTLNESFCNERQESPVIQLVAAIGLIALVAILLAKVK
jgi:hypothetical protein